MPFVLRFMFTLLTGMAMVQVCQGAEDIAWGDVSADGSLETRSLDVPVAMARGADNFFIADPMDSHDWSHTSAVRNSLSAQRKAHIASGASTKATSRVARFEEALQPIFSAMPKEANGRLNNGTARYALHRHFSERYGWSVKGLQPAGAAWVTSMSVTPDVKDVSKYMVPSYIQDLLLAETHGEGFDIHSLAIVASTIEHLAHSEMISLVYSIFTTLELPVPGKKTEQQVAGILDTFMMVFAFGLNLDVSVLDDVQKAKAHLERSHSGWPQIQAFANDITQRAGLGKELDFDEIVLVAEKIGESYAQFQGKDCQRVKEELKAKPSYHNGRVQLSEVQPSHAVGRRSLFTESAQDLEKLGVLSPSTGDDETELIISNYVNSQSMCLSTSSFYAACCINECEGLLARLEREVAAPTAKPDDLARLMTTLPGPGIADGLLQQIQGLVDEKSGLVPLHGRALAGWMHRAFPLECPAPDDQHNQKVTNPKTPDEWIGDSSSEVQELFEMLGEISQVLAQYTTMGKKAGEDASAQDFVSDPSMDIVRIRRPSQQDQGQSRFWLLGAIFRIAAMFSMVGLVTIAAKSSFVATRSSKDKHLLNWTANHCSKDFV